MAVNDREAYPAWMGLWTTTNSPGSEGYFFLWFNPQEPSGASKQTGVILDRFGFASFDNWILTPKEIRFDKKYLDKLMVAGALRKTSRYWGKVSDKGLGGGQYRTLRTRKNGPNYYHGFFSIQKYPQDMPTLDCVVRETCRKAVMDFGHQLGLDFQFVPKEALPVGKNRALAYVTYLGRKISSS
jgi:hypothetical protein